MTENNLEDIEAGIGEGILTLEDGRALLAELRRCWGEIERLKKSQGSAPEPHYDPVWDLSDLTPEV